MSRVTAIEIGLYYTKVCEADYKKKNTKIYKTFIFPTPDDTIEDGYIRDKNNFADELRRQLKIHKFNCKNVVFSIASNKILSREVVIPAVKDNRIMDIVHNEANEYFPMDISEHELTYAVLEELPETKQKRIMVYAAPTNLVRNYYTTAELVGVNLVALDYVGNSVYQAMRHLQGTEVKFVVQINQQNTMVSVLKGESLVLQRNINFGVANIVDVVLSYKEYENLTPSECYRLICTKRFIRRSVDESDMDENTMEISGDMMDEVYKFVNSINRIIEYYNANDKESKIEKIYLVGRGTRIVGISGVISEELALPTELVSSLHGITFRKFPEAMKDHLNELFSCAGAAINPVNFIPADMIQKGLKKDNFRLYLLLLLLVVVASGTLLFNGYMRVVEQEDKKKELESERENYLYINEVFQQFSESNLAIAEAENIRNNAVSMNEHLNELIASLEQMLPRDSIVQTMSVSEETIFMSFVVDSKETAAQLLVQLKKIPYLTATSVSGITDNIDEETGMGTVTFSVSMIWNPLWEVLEEHE